MTDTTILLLLALKNNWDSSGSGNVVNDITFSTGWYSSEVQVPQITVMPIDETNAIMEIGSKPTYGTENIYAIDLWIRPATTSGTSFGAAKNSMYNMRREVKRILRSTGSITTGSIQEFVVLHGWRVLNETAPRPVIFRTRMVVGTYKYSAYNEG